jgi:hypothetical protein
MANAQLGGRKREALTEPNATGRPVGDGVNNGAVGASQLRLSRVILAPGQVTFPTRWHAQVSV